MKKRYHWIDNVRALAIISMVLYHAVWDLVFLYGLDLKWYSGTGAYLWQQSICWTFILISGFCWGLSKHPLKHGLLVLGAGALVQVVTGFLPAGSRIVFGVLTLLGSAALLMIPLKKVFEKIPSKIGVFLMSLLFAGFYGINDGFLGFFNMKLVSLPSTIYQGTLATYLGFTEWGFYSADYFSLLPWCFLYFAGYFLWRLWKEEKISVPEWLNIKNPVFSAIAKNSLLIYLLHQPIIYGILELFFS